MAKWIRWPGPGEFRGEGKWRTIDDLRFCESDWEDFKKTGYLPVHEGDEPPPGDAK